MPNATSRRRIFSLRLLIVCILCGLGPLLVIFLEHSRCLSRRSICNIDITHQQCTALCDRVSALSLRRTLATFDKIVRWICQGLWLQITLPKSPSSLWLFTIQLFSPGWLFLIDRRCISGLLTTFVKPLPVPVLQLYLWFGLLITTSRMSWDSLILCLRVQHMLLLMILMRGRAHISQILGLLLARASCIAILQRAIRPTLSTVPILLAWLHMLWYTLGLLLASILDRKITYMVVVVLAVVLLDIVCAAALNYDVLLVVMDRHVLPRVMWGDSLLEGEIVLTMLTGATFKRCFGLALSSCHFKVVVDDGVYLLWLSVHLLTVSFVRFLVSLEDVLPCGSRVSLVGLFDTMLLNWFRLTTINWMTDKLLRMLKVMVLIGLHISIDAVQVLVLPFPLFTQGGAVVASLPMEDFLLFAVVSPACDSRWGWVFWLGCQVTVVISWIAILGCLWLS